MPQTTSGTDLDMLTRLDELPHQRLQLVVPLDQVAQVGVQGLLWETHTRKRRRETTMTKTSAEVPPEICLLGRAGEVTGKPLGKPNENLSHLPRKQMRKKRHPRAITDSRLHFHSPF